MILLYTLVLGLLGVTHFLLKRRVVALEKKYARVSREADTLARQTNYRDGNSNRADPFLVAKRQYELGRLAQKKDQIESRYVAAQGRAERAGKLTAKVRAWKGRKLPYTFGALDVVGALALIDYLGAGRYVNARPLVEAVTALFTR